MDLANAIGPSCKHEILGIRDGEKIHEEMITTADSSNTIDLGDRYAILPPDGSLNKYEENKIDFKSVTNGFSYTSEKNKDFLRIDKNKRINKRES